MRVNNPLWHTNGNGNRMTLSAFNRSALTLSLLLIGWIPNAISSNETDRLHNLKSWSETSAVAKQTNAPIVVLIEQRHCGFCQRLKREVFLPLANDKTYFDRVIFASVLIDFDGPSIELNGADISGFEFAESFEANTTPTVLFLDHSASELQKRLVGYIAGESYNNTFIDKIKNSIESSADK
jgi:thioredoxin-related protein